MKIYKKLFVIVFLGLFLFTSKDIFAFNSCSQVGNTTFCDDGTYYSQVGNTTYGSNGTMYSQIGNTTSLDRCPYNSSFDFVLKKCKCNSGYEANGSSCVYKPTFLSNPTNPSLFSSPSIPVAKPITVPKTNDQVCSEKFGQNWKWDGTKNSAGGLVCGCKNGYIQNNGECVAAPIKTNDQICQDDFGLNSNWDGTRNDKGGLVCGCKFGYVWNKQGTNCIVSLAQAGNTTLPYGCTSSQGFNVIDGTHCGNAKSTKTNDQICADDYGVNSIWDKTFNDKGGLMCDCKAGYQWDQGQTQCVITPKMEAKAVTPTIKKELEIKVAQNETIVNSSDITNPDTASADQKPIIITEEIKPKSFWNRLKGWLGF